MRERCVTRREFLKGAASAAVLIGAAGVSSVAQAKGPLPAAAEERPNLVFVFADQLRACSVGCYGEPDVQTPHLDLLAAQGARFARALATSPLSSPYRACVQTGRYPTVNGVRHNNQYLPAEEVCIAEVLAGLGYRTAFIGKWFLDMVTPGWDFCVDPQNVPLARRQGNQWWVGFNCGHQYYGGRYYEGDNPTMRTLDAGVYEPDYQFSRAIEFIADHRSERFCLVMSIGTPHNPTCRSRGDPPGGDYHFPYDPAALTLRPNVDVLPRGEDDLRQVLAGYYGMISNLDWNMGRLVEALDSLGLAENTVLAVSSDHGSLLGSHFQATGHYGKREIYAESLEVPFILRLPGRVAPQVVTDVFSAVDVMPTLLGLCNAPIPAGVMGRDFSPRLLRGEAPRMPPWGPVPYPDEGFAGMFDNDWVGVVTPQWTLRCDFRLTPDLLFDNIQDPYQMTNLVDAPLYRHVRDSLQQHVAEWMAYVQPGRSRARAFLPLVHTP